jgi:hypothetical protein
MIRLKLLAALFALVALLAACGDDPSKPYLKIIGGGFTNSITSNIVTYSFVAKRMKPLPEGSVLEAHFDLPDSDQKYVTWLPAEANKDRYLFESEPLHGLKKGVPLKVRLRLLETLGGKEIAEVEKAFTSDNDQ